MALFLQALFFRAQQHMTIPYNTPTETEGSILARWITPLTGLSKTNKSYNLNITVKSGEYRLQGINLATEDHYPSASINSGYTEKRMKGKIPVEELEYFEYLESLVFAKIDLPYGDITDWYKIKRLKNIYINNHGMTEGNKLSNTLPSEFGLLDIRSFELMFTNIKKPLPDDYKKWDNIFTMQIRNNYKLKGSLPDSWGYFKKINLMRIRSNLLEGEVPESFGFYAESNVAISLGSNHFSCIPKKLKDRYNRNNEMQFNNKDKLVIVKPVIK